MSNLPLHRLIADAGGLVLPLISADAPVAAAPLEHPAPLSFQIQPQASEGMDGLRKRGDPAAAGTNALRAEVDK